MGQKANVSVNPEKPGKGNFVVTVGDTVVVELRGMKRPFPPLKQLDMDQIIQNVLDALE